MTTPTTAKPEARPQGHALATEHGRTTIADSVVQKIVGVAARDVDGVYELGGGAGGAFGALRERVAGGSQGVSVEVGEKQTAIDLDVVVEYGVRITDLAEGIRRNVINNVQRMTGLEVAEVNISVDDVHLPEEQGGGQQERRVE